jgi:hypothetical protein
VLATYSSAFILLPHVQILLEKVNNGGSLLVDVFRTLIQLVESLL